MIAVKVKNGVINLLQVHKKGRIKCNRWSSIFVSCPCFWRAIVSDMRLHRGGGGSLFAARVAKTSAEFDVYFARDHQICTFFTFQICNAHRHAHLLIESIFLRPPVRFWLFQPPNVAHWLVGCSVRIVCCAVWMLCIRHCLQVTTIFNMMKERINRPTRDDWWRKW